MSPASWLDRLLDLGDSTSIESVEAAFGAGWARDQPARVALLCLLAAAASFWFYARRQPIRSSALRWLLALLRTASLALLVLTLADPALTTRLASQTRPLLWLLFDGTDSMNIVDALSADEQQRLDAALGLEAASGAVPAPHASSRGEAQQPIDPRWSRADQVRAWVGKRTNNDLAALAARFRLKAFVLDRADGVRPLSAAALDPSTIDGAALSGTSFDAGQLAAALEAKAPVTAIGQALADLTARQSTAGLAGVVVVSDFGQNAGPAPLAAAAQLGRPIYAVGVGPPAAINLSVELQPPAKLKRAELAQIPVTVRQSGLDGQQVQVMLSAQRVDGPTGADSTRSTHSADSLDSAGAAPAAGSPAAPSVPGASRTGVRPIGRRTVELAGPFSLVEFPFTPDESGDVRLLAEVQAATAEAVAEDNVAERTVHILDDFMRLFFVEHEPTWEWRFIKEVFHRDSLVGLRGFRTFLRSSDPNVRTSNELFTPTMTPPRGEFFANDVIVLGDLPAAALTPKFCEAVREFVETFGGGLVILSGPRFGPGQLASTALADMLPVVLEGDGRPAASREFRLQLTPEGLLADFMQLGTSGDDVRRAWERLGPLAWYQPVARPHSQATVLAQHPSDRCADGSPQPLIAMRHFGSRGGQVVFLGFNETWRLRRKFGEQYYRQFWGQMIHRLSLSHALGSHKRFVIRTDRPQYRPDDEVTISAELYDLNFEPLTSEQLPERALRGELQPPEVDGMSPPAEPLSLIEARPGLFEQRIKPVNGGAYQLRFADPLTNELREVRFQIAALSAERATVTRNVVLQDQLAAETGGRSYDLTNVNRLPAEIPLESPIERSVRVVPLWNTWLAFGAVATLLLAEWTLRKWAHLA